MGVGPLQSRAQPLGNIAPPNEYDHRQWSYSIWFTTLQAMGDHIVMASEFKAHCLALLDEVAISKVPVVVTKHGRPVARVVPVDEPEHPVPTLGSVTLLDSPDEAFFSTNEEWDADRG